MPKVTCKSGHQVPGSWARALAGPPQVPMDCGSFPAAPYTITRRGWSNAGTRWEDFASGDSGPSLGKLGHLLKVASARVTVPKRSGCCLRSSRPGPGHRSLCS